MSSSYANEIRNIAEGQARMETKIDNLLNISGDHEARLRIAETTLAMQTGLKDAHAVMAGKLSTIEAKTEANHKTLAGFRKALWALLLAVISAAGLGLYRIFERGVSNGV